MKKAITLIIILMTLTVSLYAQSFMSTLKADPVNWVNIRADLRQDLPACVSMLPEYTRAVVYAEGLKDSPAAKAGLSFLALQAPPRVTEGINLLTGKALVAMLEFGKGDHVTFLVGVGAEGLPGSWEKIKNIANPALFGSKNIQLPVTPEGPVLQRGKPIGFISWSQKENMVWFSNSEAAVQSAAAGKFNGSALITDNALFYKSLHAAGGNAQAFAYVDIESILHPVLVQDLFRKEAFLSRAFNALNLETERSAAITLQKGTVKGALLTRNTQYGLPGLLFGYNSPTALMKHVPAEVGYAVRTNIQSMNELLDFYGLLCGHIDPDIAIEMDTELAEFSKETGVDLQSDLLGEIKNEIILYGMTSDPMKFALISQIDNRQKMEQTLSKLFALWEKQPERKVMGDRMIFLKGGIALLIGNDMIAVGHPAVIRETASVQENSYFQTFQDKLNSSEFCTAAALNLSDIIKQARKEMGQVPPMLETLVLNMLPKYLTVKFVKNNNLIEFEISQVR